LASPLYCATTVWSPGVVGANAHEAAGSVIVQSELPLPSSTVTVPVGGPNATTVSTVTVAVVTVPTAVGLGATDTRVTTGTAGPTVNGSTFDNPLA
jgi:hypothetical protein